MPKTEFKVGDPGRVTSELYHGTEGTVVSTGNWTQEQIDKGNLAREGVKAGDPWVGLLLGR